VPRRACVGGLRLCAPHEIGQPFTQETAPIRNDIRVPQEEKLANNSAVVASFVRPEKVARDRQTPQPAESFTSDLASTTPMGHNSQGAVKLPAAV